MRVLSIAFFVLTFTLLASAYNAMNIFNVQGVHRVNYNFSRPNYSGLMPLKANITEGEYLGWNFYLGTIYVLTRLPEVFQPTYDIGGYLKKLIPILPSGLCLALTILVDFLNLVALLQILRGVSFKWMR